MESLKCGAVALWRGKWVLAAATLLAAAVAWGVDQARNAGLYRARASIRIAVLDGKPLVPPEDVAADIAFSAPAGTTVRARRAGHWNVVTAEITAREPESAERALSVIFEKVVEEHDRVLRAAIREGDVYEMDLVDTISKLRSEGKDAETLPFEERLLAYRVKRKALQSRATRVVEQAHLVGPAEPVAKAASLAAVLGAALLLFTGAAAARPREEK